MPNVSSGYELTEAEVPQLRCELRGRDAALPEEARLRLRQFDDRRRAASLGRHVSKVLDEDQGNVSPKTAITSSASVIVGFPVRFADVPANARLPCRRSSRMS